MKLIKNFNKFIFLILALIIIAIFYNFKFEIVFNTLVLLGNKENEARKISFSITERSVQIIKNKFNNFQYESKRKKDQLDVAIKIKRGFLEEGYSNFILNDGNYYFKDNKSYKIKKTITNLNFSNEWINKFPKKIWSIDMSNKNILDKKSDKVFKPIIVQAKPLICGEKLVYAKQDGNIGAVDFRSGKRIWYNKYGNSNSSGWPRLKGFNCIFDKDLNKHIILLSTGSGIFCINSQDGSLTKSRCNNGRLGAYETRVSAEFFNNTVYVATINPSGIQAYNFLNGKLLWHKELGGANPWNNFIIDKKREMIFLNMGSPDNSLIVDNSNKYKYSGSLIALNSKNGKIIWQFQEHSKDTWNHDFVGRPILSPIKINDKEIVITFSKSGSVYFLDRDTGKPVIPVEEKIISYKNFKYKYKNSINPKNILDTKYYNFIDKDCDYCGLNTKIFGLAPPIIKYERYFDGSTGGPQWATAAIDYENNLIIFTSIHNIIFKHYIDFIPNPLTALPNNNTVKNCTSCHESKGDVKVIEEGKRFIPSLFLSTKVHSLNSFKEYIKNNKFHKNLDIVNKDLEDAYFELRKYDDKLVKNEEYEIFSIGKTIDITNEDIDLKNGPFGKINAISLLDGKIKWQIPAGTYFNQKSKTSIVGSKTFGAISNGQNNDGVSFYTGSFDKKVYAINNKSGEYLWSADLPASGSALPLVHIDGSDRWIFVIATGGRVANDYSDSIIAFHQKLN